MLMKPTKQQVAFITILESHRGIVYKIAQAYCKNPEDRQDLVQEIIFQLWKSFDKYNANYKHTTWVYRIALNVSISFFRKENSRPNSAAEYTGDLLNFPDETPVAAEESDLSLLHRFIDELKALDKALMLLYLEKNSYKEMAAIMGISESNVATRINRIKNNLKLKFSKTENQKL